CDVIHDEPDRFLVPPPGDGEPAIVRSEGDAADHPPALPRRGPRGLLTRHGIAQDDLLSLYHGNAFAVRGESCPRIEAGGTRPRVQDLTASHVPKPRFVPLAREELFAAGREA